ncbi:ATP-binding protein [Streptomyces longwoodensis]|uniref:ATP-binding protein n=1 Tax=Streptomyces longwoodensis TaxID=68231 RepID=UPI0036F4CC71
MLGQVDSYHIGYGLEAAMAHSSEERYDPLSGDSPQPADQARDVARGFLSVLAPSGGDEADAVLLVVTELISNAVRHAGGVTGFGLRAGPGTVTVTVHDASRQPPRLQLTDPREPGGFAGFWCRSSRSMSR